MENQLQPRQRVSSSKTTIGHTEIQYDSLPAYCLETKSYSFPRCDQPGVLWCSPSWHLQKGKSTPQEKAQ